MFLPQRCRRHFGWLRTCEPLKVSPLMRLCQISHLSRPKRALTRRLIDSLMVVSIEHLQQHIGETVDVQGWLAGSRTSGKIAFLGLRDGSGFVQGVLAKTDVDEPTFKLARSLTQESSVVVTGTVRADERAPSGVELGVTGLKVVAETEGYPITPKAHGVDFLMEHRHLYLRHRGPWAIMRIRDELERAVHDFFGERGFVRFDAPFFTPNAAEGTTNLFEIDLFGEDTAYLSQSGQLYAEAGALALGKVYTFGPTFRAEKSKTRKHLLEFWMIEPEVAYLEHEGNMRLQEDFVAYLVGRALENRRVELEMLERDTRSLEATAQGSFPRLTYDEALAKLAEHGEALGAHPRLRAPEIAHRGARAAARSVCLVSRPAPLRVGAALGLRARLRAAFGVDYRRASPARGHPFPAAFDPHVSLTGAAPGLNIVGVMARLRATWSRWRCRNGC